MSMLRTLLQTLTACLLLSLLTPPAHAGQEYGMTFSCAAQGSERVCYGSLRAARRAPASTDFAEFRLDGTGYLYFNASSSNVRYACNFDPDASARLAPAAMGDYNVYFSVRMNAQGQCLSNSYFTNSSSYQTQ